MSTTYGDIRTKFLTRVRRRDCTTSLADGFIEDAITRLQRIVRLPAMEKSVAYTVDDNTYGDGRLAIPSDYLMMREFSVTLPDGTKRTLDRKALSEVQGHTDLVSYPVKYARQDAYFVLAPYPQSGCVLTMDYYGEFDDLSEVDDETVLSNIASDAIIFGALSYACDHFEDKRGPRFEQRFIQIVADIQDMADRDELSGVAAVAPAFSYPADD